MPIYKDKIKLFVGEVFRPTFRKTATERDFDHVEAILAKTLVFQIFPYSEAMRDVELLFAAEITLNTREIQESGSSFPRVFLREQMFPLEVHRSRHGKRVSQITWLDVIKRV